MPDECAALPAVQQHLRRLATRLPVVPALEAEWRRFYDEHDPLVRQVVTAAGIARAWRDDCVQEAWLEIARVLPRFRYDPSRGSLRTWLKTVALRTARRAARRLDRPRELAGGDLDGANANVDCGRVKLMLSRPLVRVVVAGDPLAGAVCPRTPCPALSSMQTELRQAVRTAIVEFRVVVSRVAFRVFLWCEVRCRPTEAVAARLGLSVQQVWTHRSRTRQRFRRFLEAGAFCVTHDPEL